MKALWCSIILTLCSLCYVLPANAASAFAIANEIMMYEQSQDLSYIADRFGVDPASPLSFTTYVDPAGHSFTYSLKSGSTYQGRPIVLTVSGALTPERYWDVSSSGSYGGVPWTSDTKYVSSTPLLPTPSDFHEPPVCLGCNYYSNSSVGVFTGGPGGFSCLPSDPNCVVTTRCDNKVYSLTGADSVHCFGINGMGHKVDGTDTITHSWWPILDPNTNWWWVRDSSYLDLSASGLTPGDGSQGSSTATFNDLKITSVDYFTDLGTDQSTYNCCGGWPVFGAGSGTSFTSASEFTAAASGPVSNIDLGVGYIAGTNSFYAALYTDNAGQPGFLLAEWDGLSSKLEAGQCCGVVNISDITGLNLSEGASYFLVLGPSDFNSTTQLQWNANTQNVVGLELYSEDGGQTWNSNGQTALGAFDILQRPEGITIAANQFSPQANGSVSQIDVSVGYVSGENSFYAALYTSDNGLPGTQLVRWDDLSSSQIYNNCCGLISITGISGLNLMAGQNYFLVIGPENLNSTTVGQWNVNSVKASGVAAFSLDGGLTWNSRGVNALGAFDVLASDVTLFSDLGSGDQVYACCMAYQVSGGTNAPTSMLSKAGAKAPAGLRKPK